MAITKAMRNSMKREPILARIGISAGKAAFWHIVEYSIGTLAHSVRLWLIEWKAK